HGELLDPWGWVPEQTEENGKGRTLAAASDACHVECISIGQLDTERPSQRRLGHESRDRQMRAPRRFALMKCILICWPSESDRRQPGNIPCQQGKENDQGAAGV
ncbi:hypothetical protein, partial [Rhodococcus sp. T2V]|uniref:hypothetical protein n=1 Tax=Rhodococcus sp. T2V TaxID=3034164 RepID=UPI0023E26011